MSNKLLIKSVTKSLSAPRMSTYFSARPQSNADDITALELYAWNAEVSGCFMTPLHLCEVVIRNAVSEVLENVYGPSWPSSKGFLQSLPHRNQGYSVRDDLQRTANRYKHTSRIIPEMTFAFWLELFKSRYEGRLWSQYLSIAFPNADPTKTYKQNRQFIYDTLDNLRKLRNRIAHHEPIFSRKLNDDYQLILLLIEMRCLETASWLDKHQLVTNVLPAKP